MESPDPKDNQVAPKPPKLTFFITVLIGHYFSATIASLPFPFLPIEAEAKGIKPSGYGFVYSTFFLFYTFASPIMGSYVTVMGLRNCFCVGMLLLSVSTITFGCLHFVDSAALFLTFAISLRIVEALGEASYKISSLSLISKIYTESSTFKISIAETLTGLGFISGAALGGFLFDFGGFLAPFVTVGGLLLINTVLSRIVLPDIVGDIKKPKSVKKMWKEILIFGVFVDLCAVVVAGLGGGFIYGMLEYHLEQFKLNVSHMSLLFCIPAIVYIMVMPLWGKLVNRYLSPRYLLMAGLALRVITFSILGPLPIPGFKPSLQLIILSLFLYGISSSCIYMGGLNSLINQGKEHSTEEDATVTGLMSSLYTMTFSTGFGISPGLSGTLMDVIGYRWESSAIAFLTLLVLVLVVSHSVCNILKNEEERPLLGKTTNNDM